ncbi:MAG: hypothetical protein KJ970_01645 [Candidatus Eisenbacteria bacterium]|uniref:Uncharacterized protein n=1 Tax=Eiseniibacteriota bacterium TaxID=2212470 RepID=A0A948RV95_UNCEI|nr:hypothetical protein [Candidatus Eisenbacteria bacterium]MBU1950155.1 hypothetical protein [Candidatus Eisenbacteria bacterium]MBU2689607.1 hypothetical protein [Candidatus Eisenbacteria bacterium]
MSNNTRVATLALILIFFIGTLPLDLFAARAEEPMLTITKNTLYGALTGLVLGGTLTLVVDEEKRDDVVRWGVVIGTFGGFGFGLYTASRGGEDYLSRWNPQETADVCTIPGPLALRLDPPLARWTGASNESTSGVPTSVSGRRM